jgi:hypothetical protein
LRKDGKRVGEWIMFRCEVVIIESGSSEGKAEGSSIEDQWNDALSESMFVELQFLVSLRVEKNKELGREELIQIGYGLEFTKIVLEEMGVFDDNLDRTKRFCK